MRDQVFWGVWRGYLLGLAVAAVLFVIVNTSPLWVYVICMLALSFGSGKAVAGLVDRTTDKVEEQFAKFTD